MRAHISRFAHFNSSKKLKGTRIVSKNLPAWEALKLLAETGDGRLIQAIRDGGHVPAREFTVSPDVISFTSSITACERAAQWQRALVILTDMPKKQILPNVISFNAAITACERGNQSPIALKLFEKMPEMKITPDVISYNATISSCGKGLQWQQALMLFLEMGAKSLRADQFGYNAASWTKEHERL
eukprot:g17472.t1